MAGRPEDRAPRLDNPSETGVLPDTQEGRDEGRGSSAATLLPSECPNCGRLHQGHDFNENPGPIQADRDFFRVRMMVAVSFLDSDTLDKFHEHVAEIDAKHREGTYGR